MNNYYKTIHAGDFFEFSVNDKETELFFENSMFAKFELLLTNRKGQEVKKNIAKDEVVFFNSSDTENFPSGYYDLFLFGYIDDVNKKSLKLLETYFFIENIQNNTLSDTEEMVKILEQAIKGRVQQEYLSYTINGRTITKYSPKELVDLLQFYKEELYKEKMAKLTEQERSKKQLRLINIVQHDF